MSEDECQCHRTAADPIRNGHIIEHCDQRRIDRISTHDPTAGERTPCEHRRPMLHRVVEHAITRRLGRDRGEFGLDRRHRLTQMGFERSDLRHGVIGDADGTDESSRAQIEEHLGHLGRMREKVGSMDHVEVHRLHSESTQ